MAFSFGFYHFEHSMYWIAWVGGILYSIYTFAIASQSQRHLLDNENDLKRGTLSKNAYDASDLEWQTFKNLCMNNWSIVFVHVAISNIFNYYQQRTVKLIAWILLSLFTIYHVLNLSALLLIVVNVIIVVLLAVLGKNILGYLLFIGVVISAQVTDLPLKIFGPRALFSHTKSNGEDLDERYDECAYLLTLVLCYLNARGLSAVVDNLTLTEKKNFQAGKKQFFDKLFTISAYMLYLPGVFTGPMFTYDDFEAAVQDRPCNQKLKSYARTMWELIRFLASVLLFELMLHWIYSSAYLARPSLVSRLNSWQLSGFLCALCLMYYHKYMCIYGFFRAIVALDGMQAISPPLPQCPWSMHKSSQLYRNFDVGFYRWMTKYVYKPIAQPDYSFLARFCATIAVFLCVTLWHLPITNQIIYWISMNVLCVIVEMVSSTVARGRFWTWFEAKLSRSMMQRIYAILACPMFAIALISSVYFLSTFELATFCVHRLVLDGRHFALMIVFLYFGSHVSMDYEHISHNSIFGVTSKTQLNSSSRRVSTTQKDSFSGGESTPIFKRQSSKNKNK